MKLPNIFENQNPPLRFQAGEVIFSAGQPAELMYLVKKGEVEISRDGRVIETIGVDGFFGELALVDAQERSATAKAKTDCELTTINEKQFLFMVGETPFFSLTVMREMAKRLRRKE